MKKADRKIRLIYDGTILADGLGAGSNRSGIFNVVYNVFRTLLAYDDLEVSLYCEPGRMAEMQGFIYQHMNKWHRKLEILNDPMYCRDHLGFIDRYIFNLSDIRDNLCRNRKCLRCQSIKVLLLPFKAAKKVAIRFFGCTDICMQSWTDRLEGYDAVLSPAFPHLPVVRKSGMKRYTILYDAIPYIYPDLFPDSKNGCSWNLDLLGTLNEDDVCFAISNRTKEDFLLFSKLFRDSNNDLLSMYEKRNGINAFTKNIVIALRERRGMGLLRRAEKTDADTPIRSENVEVMPLAASETFYSCESPRRILEARRKYRIPEGKKYVFSLCTLERRKNILYAIKNFLRFSREGRGENMVFVLGGGFWNKFVDELESALSDEPKWREKVLRIGYVDDADLAPLFSGAFCTVYPSIYEGFGLPPLEAMQCGCPVITSDNSSLPEVVGDAGLMIDVSRENALCSALEYLYDNPEKRKEFRRKGIERAKKFTWEKAAAVIHDRILRDFGGREAGK